jgi:hypothetical protein
LLKVALNTINQIISIKYNLSLNALAGLFAFVLFNL